MNFEKLYKHLNKRNGVFFEAGANDGVFQSYTHPLETEYGWTGVLVEPSQSAFNACKGNRPNSICINAALTDDESATEIVGDFDGHPMSSVNGSRLNRVPQFKASATTLNKVFDQHLNKAVDLMSIDVENFEYQTLNSLNYSKHHPNFVLVEIYFSSLDDVFTLLEKNGYEFVENITNFNYDDNPGWDGTHNDYLFQYLKK